MHDTDAHTITRVLTAIPSLDITGPAGQYLGTISASRDGYLAWDKRARYDDALYTRAACALDHIRQGIQS